MIVILITVMCQNSFCASNLVVQPYLSATQSGVSMIAFHFLKPVLVTKKGGLSEYVDHKKSWLCGRL